MTDISTDFDKSCAQWFRTLRDRICAEFEKIEDELSQSTKTAGRFTFTDWNRTATEANAGGGTMGLMRGRVFEKVGVNISTVSGTFSPEFAAKIPGSVENGGKFWASGISLVAHMRSPKVPAVHMNTRRIITSKGWFGGGADLNPMVENPNDTAFFHKAFQECCERHDPEYYPKFKKWCDEYFHIKHRNESRGVGGIFYDYIDTGSQEADFAFTRDVGETFLKTYPALVREHMFKDWSQDEREHQLYKRGRYVEFNLLHDRGTVFGLNTGGNVDAILMSLPPEAKWA